MTIETWQERVIPELHSDNISRDYMQNEIYDLRAALKEREAKIERLTTNAEELRKACTEILKEVVETWLNNGNAPALAIRQAAYQEVTRATVQAFQINSKLIEQHKVLEQALEALKYVGAGSYQQHAAAITAV